MKKGSIIGTIIVIIVVGIRWFLEIDHVKDNHVEEVVITGNVEEPIEEEIIEEEIEEPEDLTGEEEIFSEENEEIEEIEDKQVEPEFLEDYPKYGVIENDYGDEIPEDENDENLKETEQLLRQALDERDQEMKQEEIIKNISVTIDGKKYIAELENNETAQSFYKDFLVDSAAEFLMEELNGNEKYVYLQAGNLPTNSKVPEKIEAGDIMLYGSNCIVIFYKSFTTSYSYTKIGHISNLGELGDADVKVVFSK